MDSGAQWSPSKGTEDSSMPNGPYFSQTEMYLGITSDLVKMEALIEWVRDPEFLMLS